MAKTGKQRKSGNKWELLARRVGKKGSGWGYLRIFEGYSG